MMPRVLRGIYQRAFVERLQAITRRLDTAIGEIMSARSELADLRAQLAGVEAKQDALDQHVQTVIAGGWDATALSRRLAELEDRLADLEPPHRGETEPEP